ncbi:hypothetical protein GDO86_013200 [Hymenochirus boettgeri]|uniref:Uncharacterized protein n=1 Tax=Hymenochirus boettgeri TaxID=247094 RepID=A0A8T2IQD5_9PIPI|nr:hypothetical protein GDO86_013200 [Hymenochirus boettgeri]
MLIIILFVKVNIAYFYVFIVHGRTATLLPHKVINIKSELKRPGLPISNIIRKNAFLDFRSTMKMHLSDIACSAFTNIFI